MPKRYTFFIHMKATKHWLSLSIEERGTFFQEVIREIFERYPNVRSRLYDINSFPTKCSDIAVHETENIDDFHSLREDIRKTKIFTVPYFEIVDIIPTVEEGFLESQFDKKKKLYYKYY